MTTTLLVTLQFAFAAGIATYWAVFFVEGAAAFAGGVDPSAFLAFESAFPVADGCLAVTLAIAGRWLLRRDSRGVPLTLVASGALVFLGLLDAAFNLQNGAYGGAPARAAVNGFLNAACILGGIAMARMAVAERRSPATVPRTCTRVRRSSGRPRSSPRGEPRTLG